MRFVLSFQHEHLDHVYTVETAFETTDFHRAILESIEATTEDGEAVNFQIIEGMLPDLEAKSDVMIQDYLTQLKFSPSP